MYLKSLTVKCFRCFEQKRFEFFAPIILIEGSNGSGKSSLLEALHFACYLKSFRTHLPRELIKFSEKNFTLKVQGIANDSEIDMQEPWDLTIGFSEGKRNVLLNKKKATSYKELLETYRIVSITEDDLNLIKGSPDQRRSFMDQSIFLINPEHAQLLKEYRKVLKQRNALLASVNCNRLSYDIWTEKLNQLTNEVQKARTSFLSSAEKHVNNIIKKFFNDAFTVSLHYKSKKEDQDLFEKEKILKRSLFGAHLDDFLILYNEKQSKRYASRGQQKLAAVLLKSAVASLIKKRIIFALDDFMTDFDEEKIKQLLNFFKIITPQLFITTPLRSDLLYQCIKNNDLQIIKI